MTFEKFVAEAVDRDTTPGGVRTHAGAVDVSPEATSRDELRVTAELIGVHEPPPLRSRRDLRPL